MFAKEPAMRSIPRNPLVASLALTLLGAIVASPGHSGPNVTGRWTSKYEPAALWLNAGTPPAPSPAVHMVLTRGHDGYHSQILWYESHPGAAGQFHGGVMGWKPESTAVHGDCSAYPTSRLTPLTLGNPTSDIFCSANVSLPSGKTILSGGTEHGEVGITSSIVFDPLTLAWTPQGAMAHRRWYPTTTVLPDGRIMVASGSRFGQMHCFGGRDQGGTLATDSLEFLGMTVAGDWNGRGKTAAGGWPLARDAHAACWNATISEWTLFGGRNQDGTYRDDTFFMYQNPDKDQREDYTAVDVSSTDLPSRPARRGWASLVSPGDLTVVMFGGLNGDGVRNDLLRSRRTVIGPSITWDWDNISGLAGGTAPDPRFGHTAVWDSTNKKMLIFGGAAADGSPVDSTLHALTILPTGVGSWSEPAVDDDPVHGRPSKRDGHVFVIDPYSRSGYAEGAPSGYRRRFVLFGGRRGSIALDDLWILWVPDPGAGNYRWKKVNPAGARPDARFHLAADFDFNDRFVITGGSRSGTITDQVWAIPGGALAKSTPDPWVPLNPNPYGPRANHSMFARKLVWARTQEYFNPTTGLWSSSYLSGQAPSQKSQDWYPFHFVLPNADSLRVFAAGPDTSSYVLNLSATPPTWRFVSKSGTESVPFRGGAAVMYLPGSFMKCGSRDTDRQDSPAVATTKTLEISTGFIYGTPPTTWTSRQDMGTGRVNHNLVVLPNGQVMVNGGTGIVDNDGNKLPVFTPQLWDPATKTWSPFTGGSALAADSTIRGYHSNAILLPDGRVLTASGASYTSGDQADLDSRRITIFCPPYLFDASGNLKSRPVIKVAPDTLGYNTAFEMKISPGTILKSVCLIKPTASTHGFNQDQRYLPLNFQACDTLVAVTGPKSSRWAPPGYYLLFIVRDDDMPSIAKWIRVGLDDPNGQLPFCDGEGLAMMSGGSGSGWSEAEALAAEERTRGTGPTDLPLDLVDGRVSVRLTQGAAATTAIDAIRLTAVDSDGTEELALTSDRVLAGAWTPAASISGGEPGTQSMGSADPAVVIEPGMAMEVNLEGAARSDTPSAIVFDVRAFLRGDAARPAGAVAVLYERASDGSWRKIDEFTPGLSYRRLVFESGARSFRVECSGATQFRHVGSLAIRASSPRPAPLVLTSIEGGAATFAASKLAAVDGSSHALESGEELILRWNAPEPEAGRSRSYFLELDSRTDAGGSSMATARHAGSDPAASASFALGASRPNPSSGHASIGYSLARSARVTIRIFDAAGRLVRTLVDRDAEPGAHEIVWDGVDDQGRSVGSGIYFYRMNAGAWQSQRKLLIVRAEG